MRILHRAEYCQLASMMSNLLLRTRPTLSLSFSQFLFLSPCVCRRDALTVHPYVNERIIGGVRHGQPVAREVDVVDVWYCVDFRELIAHHHQHVERQPAERERGDHHYHQLDHLRSDDICTNTICKLHHTIDKETPCAQDG